VGAAVTTTGLVTGATFKATFGAGAVVGVGVVTTGGVETVRAAWGGGAGVGTDADVSTGATGGRPVAVRGVIEPAWPAAAGATGGAASPKAVSRSAPHVRTRKTAASSAPASTAPRLRVDLVLMASEVVGASSVVITGDSFDEVILARARDGAVTSS
jgi:hypothetical protein